MQPDQVPTPAGVAARPRDGRGYPVLAITPWADGKPDFAVTSPARILVCAVERRCSICGLSLRRDPVWRVVAAEEAVAISERHPGGLENTVPTVEPPGHRSCMLYAAVVCPWLARPNARRRLDADAAGLSIVRGAARGSMGEIGGAVVGFDSYEFTVGERAEFRYRGLHEVLPHLLGHEHLAELRKAVEDESSTGESCPPWLRADEAAAQDRAARYL